jgi:hypothetical protein
MEDDDLRLDEVGYLLEGMGTRCGGELKGIGDYMRGQQVNGLTWGVTLDPLDEMMCCGVICGGVQVCVLAHKLCQCRSISIPRRS